MMAAAVRRPKRLTKEPDVAAAISRAIAENPPSYPDPRMTMPAHRFWSLAMNGTVWDGGGSGRLVVDGLVVPGAAIAVRARDVRIGGTRAKIKTIAKFYGGRALIEWTPAEG